MPARLHPISLLVALVSAVQTGWSAEPAAAPSRRPDAAEAVQEGNVERWLQHYQRERGEEWKRAGASGPAKDNSSVKDASVPDTAPDLRPKRD